MQMRVFAIPMDGDDEATEELNRFLRGQKVLSVEKVAVVDKGRHYWSVCIEYLPRRGHEAASSAGSAAVHSQKPRIDYREILSKDEFARFAKLRDLRRQLAETDGVPVYTILTNAQIAELARSVPQTKTELGKTEGLGTAKLERYGDALLALLLGFGSVAPAPKDEPPFELPSQPAAESESEPAAAGA